MCLYPKLIKNRRYIANKKNGGIIPAVPDIRVLAVPIGCGRCMECRRQEARKWQIRLLEDIRHRKDGVMVTLTFSDESIKELTEAIEKKQGYKLTGYELDNEIATIAMHRFRERWRKEYGKSIRHWAITELGHKGTENIHMHGILWTKEDVKTITRIWGYGFVWCGDYVSERTVNYNIKYVHKQDADHKEYKPKVLTSAGIGAGYTERLDAELNKYNENGETKETYTTRTGHTVGLPVYYRNKIYTEEEKEKLWIKKLDENVRWVDKRKIDISTGTDEYYKALEEARAKNERLGYQTDKRDWDRKKYEEERRMLLTRTRIERAEKNASGGSGGGEPESVNDTLRVQDAIKPNEKFG